MLTLYSAFEHYGYKHFKINLVVVVVVLSVDFQYFSYKLIWLLSWHHHVIFGACYLEIEDNGGIFLTYIFMLWPIIFNVFFQFMLYVHKNVHYFGWVCQWYALSIEILSFPETSALVIRDKCKFYPIYFHPMLEMNVEKINYFFC